MSNVSIMCAYCSRSMRQLTYDEIEWHLSVDVEGGVNCWRCRNVQPFHDSFGLPMETRGCSHVMQCCACKPRNLAAVVCYISVCGSVLFPLSADRALHVLLRACSYT